MKAGIAGAGIMGKLLALSLLDDQWEVVLFDGPKKAACSDVAAGLLSPLVELIKNDLIIFKLGTEALQEHWPALLRRLPNEVYFQKKGSLLLAHRPDWPALSAALQKIASKLQGRPFYQYLTAHEAHELEPHLARFPGAYYLMEEGQLDNQHLLKELTQALHKQKGFKFRDTFVEQALPRKIVSQNKIDTFDIVFDCRGLGSRAALKDLRPVRGELIWLQAPDVQINRPIFLVHPRYSIYVAPRPLGTYVLGASEIESADEGPISVQTALELLTGLYSLSPRFAEARVLKQGTHCRPTFPHHLPTIHYSEGWACINGLYRHGFLIAPSLVAEVNRWLSKGLAGTRYPELWEEKDDFH